MRRYQAVIADFAAYLARRHQLANGTDLPPGRVPETLYWGVDGDSIVECIRLHHHLNPALHRFGGHIGKVGYFGMDVKNLS